jgi:hypothetical protein
MPVLPPLPRFKAPLKLAAVTLPEKMALVPPRAALRVVAPEAARVVALTEPPDWLPSRLPLKVPALTEEAVTVPY